MISSSDNSIQADGHGTAGYRNYVLAALLTVFCFEVIDKILFGLVQESIKTELLISDFQLGLLGGPALVLLNTLASLPIAYIADRSNRVTIVSSALAFWSIATAASGFAGTFLQLIGLRGMVGIGGAACLPPSHSLIADYFPVKERASALAIFGLAIPIGSLIAAIGGGWLAKVYGWRAAFIIFGVLGILAGLIVKITVKEPPRATKVKFDNPLTAFKELVAKPAFVHLTIGSGVLGLFTYSENQFLVSFMVRNFAIGIDVAALYFGLAIMPAIGAGIFIGGFLADRLSVNDARALTWVPLAGILVSAPLFLLGFSQTRLIPMVSIIAVASLFCFLFISPTFAAVQSIAGPTRRASATALFLTISTLIGYGLGPPIVGWIADRARDSYLVTSEFTSQQCDLSPQIPECAAAGGYGLKVALMMTIISVVWSAFHFWMAGRSVRRDLVD